jgi:hypothetical protein
MKKNLILMLILFTSLVLISGCKKKPAVSQPQTPVRKVEQINKLPLQDRPYVTLTPRSDGREVTLRLDNVKDADRVEYELEYQAGSTIQGVFGTIDLAKEKLPVSKKLLFGSCSRGKCRYDENVSGGSLTLRLEGGKETFVLKTDFNLQQMADQKGVFTTKDARAVLDVGSRGLPASTYLVTASTMGLPAPVESEVIAGPYAFLTAATLKLSQAKLTVKSKADLSQAKLLRWSGREWKKLKAEVSEGKISAPVSSLGTFVLVN